MFHFQFLQKGGLPISAPQRVVKSKRTNPRLPYVLIPQNIDIHALIKSNPIPIKYHKNNLTIQAEKAVLILSQIIDRASLKKSLNLAGSSFFVSLNSGILQTLVRDYNIYLKWLECHKIIEVNPQYKKGSTSRLYRLAGQYRGKQTKKYVIQSKVIRKKLDQAGICKTTAGKYSALYQDLIGLKIESKSTLKAMHKPGFLRSLAQSESWSDIHKVVKKFKNRSPYSGLHKNHIRRIARKLTIEKLNSWEGAVCKIENKHFYFKQDKTSMRLHTSAVSLKKELRKYLIYNEQRLVACDISNSQPYFSVGLFTNPKKYLPLVLQYVRTYENTQYDWVYKSIKRIMETNAKGDYPVLDSTKKYFDLVISGKFYEFMTEELTKSTGRTWNRQEAKLQMLMVLFNPPKFKKIPGRTIMKKNFPQVLRFFTLINYGFTQTKNQQMKSMTKSPYKNALSRILQRMESESVLDDICGSLKKSHPNIPLFSLHDGIATKVGDQYLVKDVMEKILEKNIGYKPRIVIEWDKWGIGRYPAY